MSNSELKTSTSASSATSGSGTAPVDYYGVLGVEKDATKTDIKKAYGQLAWKWHPLKNLAYQLQANAMFKKVAEAYAILSDDEMRRRFDAHLTDETPFPVENVNFADPYDIFDDFKSFKGLNMGDDDDIYISSASEDDEDAMSLGSGADYSRADDKNWQVVTVEYSVTSRVAGDTDEAKADSTSSADDSKATTLFAAEHGDKDDDGENGDESLGRKSVHLSTEMKPDGRTYMTKKLSKNGIETLNVVREGDITDADIADAERFVEW